MINAGAKGEMIVYWSIKSIPLNEDEFRRVPLIRYSYVFNLSQTSLFTDKSDALKIHSCEELLRQLKYQPVIKHNISRCYYSETEDYISLPAITDFDCASEYYSSLFHELIHSSGHPARLNRRLDRALEELVAEIGSAYLCGLTGISNEVVDNQTSYIDSWSSMISKEPYALIIASRLAQEAAEYLLKTNST